MKDVLEALANQLKNYDTLYYASNSGYIANDPYTLVKIDNFPFYNLAPTSIRIEQVDNIPFKQMERRIYAISIQFATKAIEQNIAVMGNEDHKGIMEFQKDLWTGIISDRTLGDVVNGIIPGYDILIDVLELEDEAHRSIGFVAGAEMSIEFYKDVEVE
jgi:hypothetical protein